MTEDNLFLSQQELILQRTVRDFANQELSQRAREIDQEENFPWTNFTEIGKLGLLGIGIDEKYGGVGGGSKEVSIVVEEIASACAATSVIYAAHLGLAMQTIARFGTEEQKKRFLPALTVGNSVAAFALSEPEGGSDVAALSTTGTFDGEQYTINGSKLFITNGDVADTFVVFTTHDKSLGNKGFDCFIIEKGSQGFFANRQSGKMGMRASSTAELIFQDCPVPAENRLGDEGSGFYTAMQILESSRISIAAQCVGIGRACLESAGRYALQRKAFGQQVANFQAIQWMLADMAVEIDASRLLTRRAAILKDQGKPHSTESAMAKLFASEAANRAASKAVQIYGGYGYFSGSPVERYFRDAKATEIYEGTSEVQRLIISRAILKSMSV